jgi:aminotransferase in exopolysaccharide biosynthesis
MFNDICSFITSLYKNKSVIPLHAPIFPGNEKKYTLDCIESTFVSSVGKYVDRIENMVKDYIGVKYAIATVNGTSALHTSLRLTDVRRNDLVITQALTFVATANAITYIGAEPVFLDVDTDTMGLSPYAVEKFLLDAAEMRNDGFAYHKNTGKRISACVPMHTFGHPAKIKKLVSICEKYNIPVIEDAAESLGSFFNRKHTGTFGKIGILSFNGNKIVTCGGGGMIITNDKTIGSFGKHITTTAKKPHKWEYIHDVTGYNYRMPNINAALGCAQLEKIDMFLENKRQIADNYREFCFKKGIKFHYEPKNCSSNYWLNAIILDNLDERNCFLKFSNEKGIMTRPIWKLMTELDMYKNCIHDSLLNSKWLEERVVNLPSGVILNGVFNV